MSNKKDSYWIPLADLMTVLMVIFLFMSVSYMIVIRKKQIDNEKWIHDYENSRVELLKELRNEFNKDFIQTKWNAILDSENLSIRFIDTAILFDYNKSEIKDTFKSILSDFLPRYLKIILQKKYDDKIAEIRIEGHTSDDKIPDGNTSAEGGYIYNLKLSQDRTRNVLEFLFGLNYYDSLDDQNKKKLQYLLTANGLSYGRTIDSNGNLTYKTKKAADNVKCRRVEFRIVTTSKEQIDKALININK